MSIRNDFLPVAQILYRLLNYADTFDRYNTEDWSHLKHKEDFNKVYTLPQDQRAILEDLYGTGRDISVFMSRKLEAFNDSGEYPTLSSYINSFQGGWLYQLDILTGLSEDAKSIASNLGGYSPWAIDQMIILYNKQLVILEQVKKCLDSLKSSDIYKWENGQSQDTFSSPQNQQILEHIHRQLLYFSKVPHIYEDYEEEDFRDSMLSSIAPVIEGSITGESFNHKGKTDILIQGSYSTNLFIGECKVWRGKSCIPKTIDQLLSYLTWNDTKAAVIFFVRNQDLTSVIKEIKENFPLHSNFYEKCTDNHETWLNFKFSMNGDSERKIDIACLISHIPNE